MKISELQDILKELEEEYGDIPIKFKTGREGFYFYRKRKNFKVIYSPYDVKGYDVEAGYSVAVDDEY